MLDDLHAEREGLQELFGSFENALRKIVAGIRPSAALAEIDRNPADIKARIPHIGEDHCVAAHDLQSANVQVSSARPLQWHEFYRKKFRRTSIFHLLTPLLVILKDQSAPLYHKKSNGQITYTISAPFEITMCM
jgi:hypothetical protein